MTLLLRRGEAEPLLDLPKAMAVLERAYEHQAAGRLDESPPLRLMGRKVRLVAGGLPVDDRVGIRLSVGSGGDHALALVYDTSGTPLCIMGYPFSELRVAATMGLAIDRLAPRDVRSAGLIGSGRLAPSALDGAMAVRGIERVRVYSPTASHREEFAAAQAARLGVPVAAVSRPEDAVERAAIVLVSTNAPEPALRGRWLHPEQAVFGCGRPNEFDDEVYLRASRIVVSSKLHEQGYYDASLDRPLVRLTGSGRIPWEDVAELGAAVAGSVPGGPGVVFRESQGGYSDVALASYVYERALALGLGTEASF